MEQKEKRKKIICDLLSDSIYSPMKEKELAMFLQVSREERENFHEILQELLREGKICFSPKGKIMKGAGNLLTGTFISNPKGFGFLEVEGATEDYYISVDHTLGAFHRDIVQAVLLPQSGGLRKEAQITQIISHGLSSLVGTYQPAASGNYGFVLPDIKKLPQDIFVAKEHSMGAVEGHKVVVELISYGGDGKSPEGKITEILGHVHDPGVDIMSIVRGYDLPVAFSEKQLNQAVRVAGPVSESDCRNRLDLRDQVMITIDGEDAKDLDDAVSLTMEGDCYLLGVHIADVSNYVQENSALDWEAKERGTSVYLVDRVIPMLPQVLSNGICSLNEGEDRLTLSCLMKINSKGEIIDHTIAESVIRSKKRMTYTRVWEILSQEPTGSESEGAAIVQMLHQMKHLADILRRKRRKRGSIDFDFPESKIILDENGEPISIKPYERNGATKLIEDFMLAANETVAEHFYWMETPFVYRNHDNPDTEKIEKLGLFLQNFGYHIKGDRGEIHPKEYQKLLEEIEGSPEEALISRLTLRSMKQAKYEPFCKGHFGLACQYYCHFTSPIRRYPDLQIHRIIKESLRGKLNESRSQHYNDILAEVSSHCSKMERRADEAERETEKLKKAQYMLAHLEEEYEGVISGITAYGLYIELENTIEGLVHISTIPGDYFLYDESIYELVGEHTGKRYCLGERVRIRVKDADLLMRTIDFELI